MTKYGTDRMELLYSDLFDACYMLKQTLKFRGSDEIGRTIFFKTISNLILDYETRRFIIWTPHPFGAIPIIPAKAGKVFNRDAYLDDKFVDRIDLWNWRKNGRNKLFWLEKHQQQGIENKLQADYKFLLSGYAQVYSLLNGKRLNQLTTCRNENLTFKCSNYEENLWLKNIVSVIDFLHNNYDIEGRPLSRDSNKRLNLFFINTAVVALQISEKIDMFEDLSNLKGELMDSLESLEISELGFSVLDSISPEPNSERLIKLKKRGQIARNMTTLMRLISSAFGIHESSALSKIDKRDNQLLLFDDYNNSIYRIAVIIGKELGIKAFIVQAKEIQNCYIEKRFKDAIAVFQTTYLKKYVELCDNDKNKIAAQRISKFSIIEKMSFLEFKS